MGELQDEADLFWGADRLMRRQHSEFLFDFALHRHQERIRAGRVGALVLNVDAEWGRGKTFFLQGMWRETLAKGHAAVFVDAWSNEFGDDPYAAFVSEIEEFFRPHVAGATGGMAKKATDMFLAAKENLVPIAVAAGKGIGLRLADKALGKEAREQIGEYIRGHTADTADDAVSAVVDEIGAATERQINELLDSAAAKVVARHRAARKGQTDFKINLKEAIEAFADYSGKRLPFFIFIDELDRCRPTYAIQMLERVKHLFDIEHIVFVVATDTEQLSQSVKAIYGQGFNGRKYLQRFFSRTYLLPGPSLGNFVSYLVEGSGVDFRRWAFPGADVGDAITFLSRASEHLLMRLRDIEQCLDLLFDITTSWSAREPIELSVMYPMIFAHIENLACTPDDGHMPLIQVAAEMVKERAGRWSEKVQGKACAIHSIAHHFNAISRTSWQNIRKIDENTLHQNNDLERWYVLTSLKGEFRRLPADERETTRSIIRSYQGVIEHAHLMHPLFE